MLTVLRQSQTGYGPSRRNRAGSFAASLAICALLFVMLIQMGAFAPVPEKRAQRLVAIDLSDTGQAEPRSAAKAKAPQQDQQRTPDQPQVMPSEPTPIPRQPDWPPGFIQMKSSDYAAADIANMKRAPSGGSAQGGGNDGGGSAQGPGEGPGGVRLHNAEWYREPSRAELATYMPPGRGVGGWAEIACRTVDKYHVEDCQELGESPRGSGLARALRQASWQFLVRPPRQNGKPMVGAWVRIHFDITAAKGGDGGGAEGG